MKPLGKWALVRPLETDEFDVGGIVLMRGYAIRSFRGEVVRVGKDVEQIEPGDIVWYEAHSAHPGQTAPLDDDMVLLSIGETPSSAELDHLCQSMLKNRSALSPNEFMAFQKYEDQLGEQAKTRRVLPGQTSQPKAGIFAKEVNKAVVPLPGWVITRETPVEGRRGALVVEKPHVEYVVEAAPDVAPVTPGEVVLAYPYSGVTVGHASSNRIALRYEELLASVERVG